MPADSVGPAAPHRCHAQDCPTEIPPEMFMCPPHWSMVPASLRDSLKATVPAGQDINVNPSAEFLAFAQAAIAAVAHTEARRRRRTARIPKKPVQLTLF